MKGRSHPKHPVEAQAAAHEGRRPERPGWVHGHAVEWTSRQHVDSENEENRHGLNGPQATSLGVDGGGVQRIDQPERQYYLQDRCVQLTDPADDPKPQRPAARGHIEEER